MQTPVADMPVYQNCHLRKRPRQTPMAPAGERAADGWNPHTPTATKLRLLEIINNKYQKKTYLCILAHRVTFDVN